VVDPLHLPGVAHAVAVGARRQGRNLQRLGRLDLEQRRRQPVDGELRQFGEGAAGVALDEGHEFLDPRRGADACPRGALRIELAQALGQRRRRHRLAGGEDDVVFQAGALPRNLPPLRGLAHLQPHALEDVFDAGLRPPQFLQQEAGVQTVAVGLAAVVGHVAGRGGVGEEGAGWGVHRRQAACRPF